MTAPDTSNPRPALDGWSTASAMHARVVGAVIMRDLQTRFGTGYLGFLLGLIMPLGHLTIAMVITALLGRPAPLGSNTIVFLMTGVLPFIIWLYTHRQIMTTIAQNRPLLNFPNVDIFDLFMARIIVEIANSTLVVTIVISSIFFVEDAIFIDNWPRFISGLIYAWMLGVGTGIIFGCFSNITHIAFILGNILGPLLWATSGVFFLPDELPEKLGNIIFFNPLAQIICDVRVAYYAEFTSSFLDIYFINYSILIIFFSGMALVPIMRRIS
ncbi:ABC transporter permease [Xanthobacter dioxanivorans]|uniref:ABC transporter permease n=1 Tax=Xanthobacter dioxanivorans TaxID=2528964 RepID=A0A974PKI9_9HYPH|nr:ABC transporter permease [Xanthobacter dioxanivorans]QRG05280.1 ABC transporter permease [Xanthobacter dioxanivorans]